MRNKPLRRKAGITRAPLTTGRRKPVRKRNAKRHSAEWLRAYGSVERVEWVKSLPCVVHGCGNRDIVNMHIRGDGASRKANADQIVAACDGHHQCAHNKGIKTFAREFGLNLKALARATEAAWRAVAPPDYLHTTDPLCATCGASFREKGDQCASCASPCDSDC